MEYVYNDGGRSLAGYKGDARDCVCRAVAIATDTPYEEIYKRINEIAKSEKTGKRKRGTSSARSGVYKYTVNKLLTEMGWQYKSTCHVGRGVECHLVAEELPAGTIICKIPKHLVCVKDGIIHDTYNSSITTYYDEFGEKQINDRRAVYGYWYK